MWFSSFTTSSPTQRRPALLGSVVREIHVNLTEARLKLQQLIHFSSPGPRSTTEDGDNQTTSNPAADDDAPEDCIPATPSSLCSISSLERYLPYAYSTPPRSACYSQHTLCQDDLPNESTDALLLAPEALSDPFHVRSNISLAESDDLDSLRHSSERAAFNNRRASSANYFASPSSNSSRPERGLRSSSMTFLASLISWRSSSATIQAGSLDSCATPQPKTPLRAQTPSHVTSPSSALVPFSLTASRTKCTTAIVSDSHLDVIASVGRTPSPLLMPLPIDATSQQPLSPSQIRFNTYYGPTCVALMHYL